MSKFLMSVALAVALLSLSAPLAAHHGAATLDTTTEITLTGTVTEWIWANPHCILKLGVKGNDGMVTTWSVATSNVADSAKRGWSRRSFAVGDAVTVMIQPVKSGAPIGQIKTAVLADGSKLQ